MRFFAVKNNFQCYFKCFCLIHILVEALIPYALCGAYIKFSLDIFVPFHFCLLLLLIYFFL